MSLRDKVVWMEFGMSCVPLTPLALYKRAVQRNDQLHTPGTHDPYGPQRVNGLEHPKRGPLVQESETYKARHLENNRGIKIIILNNVFSSKSYSKCSWNSTWDISLSISHVVINSCLQT